jgi:hypothetical protein
VLLPPLLKMDYRADGYWKSAEGDMIQRHEVTFTGFDTDYAERILEAGKINEEQLIDTLEEYALAAAASLERMVNERVLVEADDPYWQWKIAFRQLTLRCMTNIYKRYFDE